MDVHVTAPFRILRAAAEPIRRFAKAEAERARSISESREHLVGVGTRRKRRADQLRGGKGGRRRNDEDPGEGMGTISRQRELRGVRLHSDAHDAADRRGKRAGVRRGARDQVRRAARAARDTREATNPARPHWAHAEEAADGVYLFCSPSPNYISGQVITVGGGHF